MKIPAAADLASRQVSNSPHANRAVAASMTRMAIGAAMSVAWGAGSATGAPKLTTLYTFTGGADGTGGASLVSGPHGSLLGSGTYGGASGDGVAFQLSPPADKRGAWAFSLLHNFSGGADGGLPLELLEDSRGNLFGEAVIGGSGPCQIGFYNGCGLVFELTPPTKGQSAWSETVLYDFAGGADGSNPQNGLVQDAKGDLFGTTPFGGACDICGTVFELAPPAAGQTVWTKTTVWTFNTLADGGPLAQTMVLDGSGRLFGIASNGGDSKKAVCQPVGGCGTVFMLTPPANGHTKWTEQTIWRFSGKDGIEPSTALRFDAMGNLLGLANKGGIAADCPGAGASGCGTVFELTPPAQGNAAWSISVKWKFTDGTDGSYPYGAGLSPLHGKYLTTTSGDGASTFGSIDLFTPRTNGAWKEDTLFSFTNDAQGANPESPLLQRNGTFYGLTSEGAGAGGSIAYGTIYSFKP